MVRILGVLMMLNGDVKKLKFKDLNDDVYDYIKEARANNETMEDISEHFGITRKTWNNWRKKNTDLDNALRDSATVTDRKLVQLSSEALASKLVTRDVVTETIVDEWRDEDGILLRSKKSIKTKRLEPDSNLIQFVLQRRAPEIWDALSVQRAEQGVDESNSYNEIIDKLLNSDNSGVIKDEVSK